MINNISENEIDLVNGAKLFGRILGAGVAYYLTRSARLAQLGGEAGSALEDAVNSFGDRYGL